VRRIGADVGRGIDPGGAGNADDGGGVGLLQEGQGRLDRANRAQNVHLEPEAPFLFAGCIDQRAGVRDHDVEPAERFRRLGHPGAQTRAVGDVDHTADHFPARLRQRRHGIVHILLVACAEADVAAFRDQQVDDRAADAAGAAGDDGAFSLQAKIHGCLLLRSGVRSLRRCGVARNRG